MRPRRGRERGQFIPLVALAAVVLLGAASLAVDLSLQTHDQRTLQNVSDAAALNGAQDLPKSVFAKDQYQGAQDALQIIRKRMGWQSLTIGGSPVGNSAWASSLASSCSPTYNTSLPPSCDITKTVCTSQSPAPKDLPAVCDSKTNLGGNAHYFSITIQTPAKTSKIAPATDLHYFEVTIAQDTQNYLAGAIGRITSTQASRSTAYHFPADEPFGFALFAKTIVATQNKSTLVTGDVYAERNVDPQASGQAGFCANGGLIILGAPQAPSSYDTKNDPGQADIKPDTAHPINQVSSCFDGSGKQITKAGTVNQTRDPSKGCTVGGAAIPATYDSNDQIRTCVADPPLSDPSLLPPTQTNPNNNYSCKSDVKGGAMALSPGNYSGTDPSCKSGEAITISNSGTTLAPGVYVVTHNTSCAPTSCYDVDITASVSYTGVTFWLAQGATLGVHGGATVSIDPAPAVASASPTDGRFPIYAPDGSVAQVYAVDNGTNVNLFGTVYDPSGVMHTSSNAYFNIDGQAIVGTWDDQGGNHTSADVTYDASRNAPQIEVLKLVE